MCGPTPRCVPCSLSAIEVPVKLMWQWQAATSHADGCWGGGPDNCLTGGGRRDVPVSITAAKQQEKAAGVVCIAATGCAACRGAWQGPAVRDMHGAYENHVVRTLRVRHSNLQCNTLCIPLRPTAGLEVMSCGVHAGTSSATAVCGQQSRHRRDAQRAGKPWQCGKSTEYTSICRSTCPSKHSCCIA